VEISESRTSIACPECAERLHPNGKRKILFLRTEDMNHIKLDSGCTNALFFCMTDVRMILNDVVMYNKYEDFMVRRVLATDPDTRWCPQPDCG
jgi:E3 ubiquitin-protein ligase RNF19A